MMINAQIQRVMLFIRRSTFTSALFLLLMCTISCFDKSNVTKDGKPASTPTTGEMTIWCEEGLRPILTTSIDVFDSIYDKAKVNAEYKDEAEIISNLLDRKISTALISRPLSATEIDYFKQYGFSPKTTLIAYDAMAIILNPSNKDRIFTVGEIKDILTGKTTSWKQRNRGGPAADIVFVFDNVGASTVRYAKDSILMGEPISSRATALKTTTDVINYVAKHPNAMGLISTNWISDTDDTGVQGFMKEIKLAEIGTEPGKEAFTPYQAYLATGQYPFKRTIWYIDASARNFSLEAGFASFLASDRGQRIIHKSGLLPANVPLRIMQRK